MDTEKKKVNWLSIALAAGMVISIAISGVSLGLVYHMYKDGVHTAEEETETQEDDVKIADQYVIRSTTDISDAYLSGDDSKLSDTDKETLQLASDVLKEITTEDMTLYEKERAVYDWMVMNITTDSGSMTVIPTAGTNVDNPHGVLKYQKAVCVGYATTFRLFMQMLDIPCKIVHNTECYHSWDEVQLDDDWYYVDVYSDSGVDSCEHFNMNDGQMASTGNTWDTSYFPAAVGTKYSPAILEQKQIKDVYAIPEEIHKAMKAGQGLVSVSFANAPSDHEKTIAAQILSSLQQTLTNMSEYSNLYFDSSWLDDEGSPVFAIYVCSYADENTESEITAEENEAMQKAILKAFKDLGVTEDTLVTDYMPDDNEEEGEADSMPVTDGQDIETEGHGE